ncbi:nucleotidyltransferase domain-containing protein [Candidatus Daviesbacteria bacterium]|nr:nucleotidyltransferase domain-containing protein [Candidatus Daviesbacteria bacterium]
MTQIQSQINFIKNQLIKKYKPQKIILFGSYAYGQPSEDSDVDLLVIADTDESFHDRISRARSLLPKDRPIDLIVLTPFEYQKTKSSNPLILEIESKGRVVYG